jgi:hypothetical protein
MIRWAVYDIIEIKGVSSVSIRSVIGCAGVAG